MIDVLQGNIPLNFTDRLKFFLERTAINLVTRTGKPFQTCNKFMQIFAMREELHFSSHLHVRGFKKL